MEARRRAADRDVLPLIALAAFVVALTVLLGRLAVTNHNVFADEANAISLGRGIAADPSVAFTGHSARGPERLTSLLLALIATATDAAHRQLWLLHALMALCQGLVAVPAWLAGRQLGLSRWAALVAAAIAASGSFAVYGIFTLNQSIGLLCATAMLWAMVRALRRPGPLSDLVVIGALGATALARIGWAPLVVALVPGVLAAVWFERPEGERLGGWLRALPMRLVRRHPILVAAFAIGVLVAIARGPSTLLGGELYGGVRLRPDIDVGTLWDNGRFLFSHLAIALALVPFMLAIPALLRDLVKPGDATSGAFAWLVLGLVVVFSYAYYLTMNEDRYLAVLGPPFALAAAVAVFRRPPPVWAVLVSGALTARLVVTSAAWPEQGPFDFFVAPSSMFFQRIVVGDVGDRLPFSTGHEPTFVVLGALAAALVVAWVVRAPHARRPLGVAAASIVLAGVLAFQVVAADYPARKFVELVGMPDLPSEATSFIDRAARGGSVRPLAIDGAVDLDLAAQLSFLEVYNGTLSSKLTVLRARPPAGALPPPAPAVQVDWRTGDAAVVGDAPDMLLQKPGFNAVGFAGTVLPLSPYFQFAQLVRLRRPLTVRWIVRGDAVQGYPERGDPLRLRVFPPAGHSACVQAGVAAHPLGDRATPYEVTVGRRTLRGTATPGAPERVKVRVRPGRPSTLVLRGGYVTLADGQRLGPTFVDVQVGGCR